MSLSFDILKKPDFRSLALSRMFTAMALQAQAVIVGWQVYSITQDPWMLGLTGLAEALPALTCALFSGHVVDTNRPQRILSLCQLALAANAIFLLLIGGGILTPEGHHILPYLYGGVLVSGIARSFIMPSAFSLLSQTVGRDEIPAASAWLNSGFQFATIAGPAAAGLIYGGYGAAAAWTVPCILLIAAFVFGQSFSAPVKAWRNAHAGEAAWQSILGGWRFILSNRVMLSVMALDMFSVLFGGAVAMLPAYAAEVLHVGSEGLGLLRAAPSMGAILTALFLATRPLKQVSTRHLLFAITGFGISIIAFGLSEVFWLSMAFLILSGAFDSVSVVMRSTLFQLLTPPDMRGRVSSVNSMFVISSNEIGAFESGTAARLLGLVPSVVFGGAACLGIVVATALLFPSMRSLVVSTKENENTK